MRTFTVNIPPEVDATNLYQLAATKFGWQPDANLSDDANLQAATAWCFEKIVAPYIARFAAEMYVADHVATVQQTATDAMTAAAAAWIAANPPQ